MSESARGNFWMTSMMKAAVEVKAAPKSTEVKSVAVPNLRADEVLIRVAVSSICGTDVHIYDWDAWAQNRIKVPLVQGHEFSGQLELLVADDITLRQGE